MSTVVVKLGGSSLQNSDTLLKLALLLRQLQSEGHKPVVIHGGGPAINQALTDRGISWQFINGQRQTTPEMISVIDDVLANKINSTLTKYLQTKNIPAVGISGSNNVLLCTQASAELQQVGNIQYVNTENIEALLSLPIPRVPVIAPIGISIGADLDADIKEKPEKYNINADWAAAKIAVALKSKKIIFLTDQKGILDQNHNLVEIATPTLIHEMISSGVIHGGMYTKVMTMMMTLLNGVPEVQVLHASDAHEYGKKNLGTRLVSTFSQEDFSQKDFSQKSLNKQFQNIVTNKEIPEWNHEQNHEMIHN